MTTARIRPAQASDRERLARMRASLWPESSFEEQLQEVDADLQGTSSTLPKTTLVWHEQDAPPTAFLEVGLRSHADGCDPARPVGYIEGWFVEQPLRHRGVGKALMQAAERWARQHGCVEMASDALIDNPDSQSAHQALGFEVVDRCVHYRKPLKQ